MILLYHKIYPEAKTIWWVTPDTFYKQMLDLRSKKVVYLDDYDPQNPDQAVITFDGVYENVWQYGVPILEKFGYPFELFVTGKYVGLGNGFDEGEPLAQFADDATLMKMVGVGGRLQWHTWSHSVLTNNPSPDILTTELSIPESLSALDPNGFKWFAYPHGQSDTRLEQETRKYFKGALLCEVGDDTDPYRLTRQIAYENTRFSKNTVSVIIPCYNYGPFVAEAIESILLQTYVPDEILFIDDASSDNSVEIAKQYLPKIQIEVNSENLGIIRNFNKAIQLTSGDYICFLGADNRFRSDYIEKTKSILDASPDVAIAYTNFVLWDSRAAIKAHDMGAQPHPTISGFYLKDFPAHPEHDIRQGNYIHGSSMYRRVAYEQAGGYSEDIYPEDHSLFTRILMSGWKAELCNDYILEYRQHSKDQANALKNFEIMNVHLRTYLQQHKVEIESLHQQLASKHEELVALHARLFAKETEAWILSTQMTQFKSSPLGRLLNVFQQLRAKIFPPGSRREAAARQLKQFARQITGMFRKAPV
jgi:glycosyltransferase involved in cell wall biosynthesis